MLHSRKILTALLLLAAGVVKLPLEQEVSDDLHAQHLIESPPSLSLRENLGQMGFAASLGGLRSLVASITYLEAYSAFEDVDWGKVDSLMTLTTRLQPRQESYWDEASWHMAYNAASFYKRDESLRPAIREKLFRDHVQRGVDILQEGLRYLPGNERLLLKLGLTYKERANDPRKAAGAFLACYANGGPDFAERMAAYELTSLGDRASSEQAYEILKRYYDMGMRKKGTTIMEDLPILEERLGIPKDKRVVAMPDDQLSPHYRPRYFPSKPK